MPSTVQLLDAASLLLASSWDMEPADFEARLESFLDESADRLAALRAVHLAAEAQAGAHRAEAERHRARVKGCERTGERVAALAERLLYARRELGESTTVPGVARLQLDGGKAPLAFAPGFVAAALPLHLCHVETSPDRDAIRAAIERGVTVPGVTLGTRGEGLRWA